MQVSQVPPNVSSTTKTPETVPLIQYATSKRWLPPHSQLFTIQEATMQQRRFIDKELRGDYHGYGPISSEESEARRKQIREDLASCRPGTKILVMTPQGRPTTLDEVYCTVSMHRREVLVAGGDKPPRSITGFVVHGVAVPAAMRSLGYATAMLRRLIGDTFTANPYLVFQDDLRQWLCIGQPEVYFSGWFDPDSVSAHLWSKFGQGCEDFTVWVDCDRAQDLKPDELLQNSYRLLTMDQTTEAITHHNELLRGQWFAKYADHPYEKDVTTQMLAPVEDFIIRVRLREWIAKGLGKECPKMWGIELHEPGHDDWAYIAFVHCFEERTIHVISYRADTKAALNTLLYLACTCDAIATTYQPSRLLIRPIHIEEFQNDAGSSVFTKVSVGYHRMAMITNKLPDARLLDVGLRLHEQDVRYY